MQTTIPFCGFYCSTADEQIDYELESLFNYQMEEISDHEIDHQDRFDILRSCADFYNIHQEYAKAYVQAFGDHFEYQYDFVLPITFVELTSPREYNFTTDRIFVEISLETVQRLFVESEDANHITLKQRIHDRFTSRSGFISFYSNDIEEWLEKPLANWDENEVGTLLESVMLLHGTDEDRIDFENEVLDTLSEYVVSNLVAAHIDWKKYEQNVSEAIEFAKA